ncbi:MAG TPA: methyl-accepting chemotaxis protein [bacterium]|nr:methyl-accepting chemotaxis protein [bacterium]HPN29718.1 methyl-accepting chemotaxis protein [bacterium]
MNLKLKGKLLSSFGITALITLIVGLISYISISTINRSVDKMVSNSFPGLENILILSRELEAIRASIRTLLSPNINLESRERQISNITTSRKIYDPAFEKYEKIEKNEETQKVWDEAKILIAEWKSINNKVMDLNNQLIEMDMLNPMEISRNIEKFTKDHYKLFSEMMDAIETRTVFEGGDDHTLCNFGKWLPTFTTKNKIVNDNINAMREYHQKFHSSVKTVKTLIKKGNSDGALKIFKTETEPAAMNVFKSFELVNAECEKAVEIFNQMNFQAINVAREVLNKAWPLIEKLVKTEEETVKKESEYAEIIQTQSKMISVAIMILAVIVSLSLGYIIAASITKPVYQISNIMKSVSAGDFTVKCDMKSKDEIGELGSSIDSTIATLASLISDIKTASDKVNQSSLILEDKVQHIASSSQETASSVEETSSTISQFSSNLKTVTENVEFQASAVTETVSAANQMSRSVKNVNSSTKDVNNSVNQTSAAIEEMTASIGSITENINVVNEKAKEGGTTANEGKISVGRSSEGIEKIKTSMTELVKVIEGLGARAENIGNIVEVIDEISEQTNLLALNAAIEAARAGEHGKGFAVVADEVRKLAERSSKATKEIAEIIQNIQTETKKSVVSTRESSKLAEDGVQLSKEVENSLENIVGKIQEITGLIVQVANAMNEQNITSKQIIKQVETIQSATNSVSLATQEQEIGVGEIVKAMENVDKMTVHIKSAMTEQKTGVEQIHLAMSQINMASQENAKSSEELQLEANNLKNISTKLSESISIFKI